MKTVKELADSLRRLGNDPHVGGFTELDLAVIAALDRLAHYDAATPEEVAQIRTIHEIDETLPVASAKIRCDDQMRFAHEHRATLLAVVARQGAEIERLTAIRDARVQDLSNADETQRLQRLEIERLKSALAAYERPLEDAEMAEIEERQAKGMVYGRDVGTLLSALRRERAEKEAFQVAALDVAACFDGRDEQTLFLKVPGINGARAVENLRALLNQQHGHLAKETGKS